MTLEDMANQMIDEINSCSHQLQVYEKATTLCTEKVLSESELSSFSEGLTRAVTISGTMTSQYPLYFLSRSGKIVYFCNAVAGQDWSGSSSSDIVTAQYN